jgi:hypothetical protein
VAAADVASVQVSCSTDQYAISGTVSGLVGEGLMLQNTGGDDLAIAADGSFSFTASVASGQAYAVTVATQPRLPAQTCTVDAGTGIVGGSNVANVVVTCVINRYAVRGIIAGLAGTVVLQNHGGDALVIAADGQFGFPTPVPSGGDYDVTVAVQPASPWQTCTVTNGSGTIVDSDVTDVTVTCANDAYSIGGTVSGVIGSGLVLRNNGADDLVIDGEGPFTFATPVPSGQTFTVTVADQPTGPTQTCTVTGHSGTVGGAPVTSVAVNCSTNTYTIGGTVSGLRGSGLVLDNNGVGALAISGDGDFAFARPIASGGAYAVTVRLHPIHPGRPAPSAPAAGTWPRATSRRWR